MGRSRPVSPRVEPARRNLENPTHRSDAEGGPSTPAGRAAICCAVGAQDPIQAVRVVVGRLAKTTPPNLSNDYDEYNRPVQELIAAGRSVLDRGWAPVALEEPDEWGLFLDPQGLRRRRWCPAASAPELWRASPGTRPA